MPYHAIKPSQGLKSTDTPPSASVGSSLPRAARPTRFLNVYTHRLCVSLSSAPCQGCMLRQCSSLVHFGRTVREICPLLNRLPLAPSRQPAKAFACEIPKLVMSYCDMHRHSLCSAFSPSAHDSGCRFPRIDALARRVCINGRHRVRTTAPRLWLCTSLQRWLCFKSAVRGLSYPEPPDFSRWRTVQASPRVPAALLRPHQPTSAEPVLLLPYSPGASPSRFASGHRFRFMTGRHAITCVSPFPRRPAPRPHRVCLMGSKGSLQTPAPVATE
jgi:hypothetical protein